jgi:hypothetical protein
MKRVFTVFALIVLFFFCGTILLRFAVKNVLIDRGIENKWTDIVMFDAKELFKKEDDVEEFVNAVREKLPFKAEQKIFNSREFVYVISDRENLFLRIRRKINDYTTDLLSFREVMVKAVIFVDFHSGNKILPNGVIDLGEGYLTKFFPKASLHSVDAFVQKVGYFKHVLDSLGIPLVYAQYPHVICDEDEVSKTDKDFTNQAKQELMDKISVIGVPVIDLHKEFHFRTSNYSKEFHHSLFYKTDHHWQAKTSIWAGQIISERLNELYGFDLNLDLLDTNNFVEKPTLKKWLGSIGKKVIPLYEKESSYNYSPKYATDINWILYYSGAGAYSLFQGNGSFDNLYHSYYSYSSTIEDKDIYETPYPFPSFSFSQNYNLPNGKKILLIGDSFNNFLGKFLALVFKEVNFIYRRSSLLDDYLANKPDVVVLGFDNSAIEEMLEDLIY